MPNLSLSLPIPLHPLAVASPLAGAAALVAWRLRETRRPLTAARIVMPPAGMATGFVMFALPAFRVPLAWAAAALALGALVFAWPVLRTTRLLGTARGVMLERSRAFLVVLLGLIAIRLALRGYVNTIVSGPQSAGLFYLLAFGMIVRWRGTMWRDYQRLRAAARA